MDSRYTLTCSINVRLKILISREMIELTLFDPTVTLDGVYGHEQMHVENIRKFVDGIADRAIA